MPSAENKHGFGFHPIFCFADATGDALSGLLRPGNAGSNTAADHVTVFDAAAAQLPEQVRAGHHEGDDPSLVRREIVVRTDAAGSTQGFITALRARNVGFFTVAATNPQIQAAIFDSEGIEEVWSPARCQDGQLRKGAAVAELTELVDLSSWPEGTRLIVRREPLHPGAQRSLFARSTTATGASTPTRQATRSTSTSRCEPTRTSRTTSSV